MKKILFILVLSISTLFCFGQNEHLRFLGIEIDGNITDFCNKLKVLGYNVKTENEDEWILKGKFNKYECELFVSYSEISNTVYEVIVVVDFQHSNNLMEIRESYGKLKRALKKEYYRPSTVHEPCAWDIYTMKDLKSGVCESYAKWNFKKGNITLRMGKDCTNVIFFTDKNNLEKFEREKKEKELEEIQKKLEKELEGFNILLESIKDKWEYEDGEVIIQRLLDFDGISKNNIYIFLKEYITKNYTDIKNVLQVDDKELGVVIIKGVLSETVCSEKFNSVYHTAKFEINGNRMRISIYVNKINDKYNIDKPISLFYPINDSGITISKLEEACIFYETVTMFDATINEIEYYIEKLQKQNDW